MGTQTLEQVELAGERGRPAAGPAPAVWRVLREAVLLATLFGVYSVGRQVAAKRTGSAFDHARELLSWQRMLPQLGFVDTGLEFGHSVYGPQNSGGVANQSPPCLASTSAGRH